MSDVPYEKITPPMPDDPRWKEADRRFDSDRVWRLYHSPTETYWTDTLHLGLYNGLPLPEEVKALRRDAAIPLRERYHRGERCGRCDFKMAVGFTVPNHIWLYVAGPDHGVLCLRCFDELATEKRIAWEVEGVSFWPVSGETWRLDAEHPDRCHSAADAPEAGA